MQKRARYALSDEVHLREELLSGEYDLQQTEDQVFIDSCHSLNFTYPNILKYILRGMSCVVFILLYMYLVLTYIHVCIIVYIHCV